MNPITATKHTKVHISARADGRIVKMSATAQRDLKDIWTVGTELTVPEAEAVIEELQVAVSLARDSRVN